ncbi:MAG: hypothetical protein GX488_05805, partial [Clostridiales bacterium]|nr:hypothetical protein [Clostridiales bacterium]
MKPKRITAFVLTLTLILSFSGCRQRTTYAKNNTNNVEDGEQDDLQKQTDKEADHSMPPSETSPEIVPETHIEASIREDAADAIKV